MASIVVVAGLTIEVFDRLRRESATRFAPGGHLLIKPVRRPGYPPQQASEYLKEVTSLIARQPESEKTPILLAYADFADESTAKFVDSFFPFALVRPIALPDLSGTTNKASINKVFSSYFDELASVLSGLRSKSNLISERTHIHNLTPLLLPIKNFRSDHYDKTMRSLFASLHGAEDPREMIDEAVASLLAQHPRAKPPNSERHAFTDGILFFKSPGKDRHGYFRHSTLKAHNVACLPSARCRLGGTYDHSFHYDCETVRGKLNSNYPGCHGQPSSPKENHVNIAPNDYIV